MARVRRRRQPTAAVDPTGVREDRALRPGRAARAGRRRLVGTGYGHDELGRPVAETGPTAPRGEVALRPVRPPVTDTGPDGEVTRLRVHRGRAAAPDRPTAGPQRTAFGYDDGGRLATADRRQRAGAGSTATTRTACSSSGSPRPGWSRRCDRDAAGRVVGTHARPGQHVGTPTTRPAGSSTITDRHGRRRFRRDAAGRLVAATDALGHTTALRLRRPWPAGRRHRPARSAAPRCELRRAGPGHRARPTRSAAATRLPARRRPAGSGNGAIRPATAGRSTTTSGRPCRLAATRAAGRDDDHRRTRTRSAGRCGSPRPAASRSSCGWDRAGRLVERRRAGRRRRLERTTPTASPPRCGNPDGTSHGLPARRGRPGHRRRASPARAHRAAP